MCIYFYFIKSDYIIVIFYNYIYGLIFKIWNIIIIDNNKNIVIVMLFKYINHLLLLLWIVVSAQHWQFHEVNIFYSTKSWL